MARKRYWKLWLAGAAAFLAAGASPALAQYKVGRGVNVTVYESPT
jgi:hypothetical protein